MNLIRNQKGFTLVELAIVLVIIGLILGAVLKGQDLINNARMKRLYNLQQEVNAGSIPIWISTGNIREMTTV